MDKENNIYEEEIKELSKKSNDELLAEILINIRILTDSYLTLHSDELDLHEEYEKYCEIHPSEQISFAQFKRLNLIEELSLAKQKTSSSWAEEDEERRKINNEKKLKAINKIKNYASNNKDWMLPNKPARIAFFYSNNNFAYEWLDFCFNTCGKPAQPKLMKVPKIEIELIIEPIYKKNKISTN